MVIDGEVAKLYSTLKPLLKTSEQKLIEEYLTADFINGGSECVCFICNKWGLDALYPTRVETLKAILREGYAYDV